MSAHRVDLYTSIHKGLRALMFSTLEAVAKCDPHDVFDVEQVARQLRSMTRLLELHLAHENAVIHPALEAKSPGVAWDAAEAHAAQVQHFADFARVATMLEASDAAARGVILRALAERLAEFVAHNLDHMLAEETRHNPALWATHTDAELRAMHRAIVENTSADDMAQLMRWTLPALSHLERVAVLKGLEAGPSRTAFYGSLALCRAHLAPRDFSKLCDALGLRPVSSGQLQDAVAA